MWQQQLQECKRQLEITDMPEEPFATGAKIGDALSLETMKWFHQ
jgi:hypothetical protein